MSGEDRRKQILDVAKRLFAEKKYQGVTMAKIAKAIGVTEPLIYRHFKSKKEILLTILKDCHEIVTSEFFSILNEKGNVLELYQKFFEFYLNYMKKTPDRAKIRILAAGIEDEAIRSEILNFDKNLENIIIKDLAKRESRNEIRLKYTAEAIARIFISLMLQRAHLIILEKDNNIDIIFKESMNIVFSSISIHLD